ncbi:MAG: glutathione synthase [Pseudomonadota bacterium]|jgi:glutathione synthase
MPQRTRLAVVMDPIEDIKYAKDTTLAMLLAAQARGHELWYLRQGDLYLRDGVARGHARPLAVEADPAAWFTLGEAVDTALGDFDAILMRKDPPFDMEFVHTTYILERAEAAGALVVNRPQGLRDMNEKVYTAWFPEYCAPTLVTRDMAAMGEFAREFGRVVVKPLDGMGGRSIFVIDRADKNFGVVCETLTANGTRFAMMQKYLPEIVTGGDTRVLLIDGRPAPYALSRMPAAHDNRGNLAAGATGVARPLTEREQELAAGIGPKLAARGMLFVGLDVIGGFVTEINVTSPTGVREIDKAFGTNLADTFIEAVERHLAAPGRAAARQATV